MTKQLQTNRYGSATPVLISDTGCAISVPIYLSPSQESRKTALNLFRTIKSQQLASETTGSNGLSVSTQTVGMAPIEQELGMSEEALRAVLFQRGGISETTLNKLTRLTGHVFVSREEIELAYSLWLDEQFGPKTIKTTRKTSKAAKQEQTT